MRLTAHAARPGRPFIEGYGGGLFRIGELVQHGPILVLPDRALPWDAPEFDALAGDDLAPILESGTVELLLLGCGMRMRPPPAALREACTRAKLKLEPMDTGAACRTFNILLAEERLVGAALYPV